MDAHPAAKKMLYTARHAFSGEWVNIRQNAPDRRESAVVFSGQPRSRCKRYKRCKKQCVCMTFIVEIIDDFQVTQVDASDASPGSDCIVKKHEQNQRCNLCKRCNPSGGRFPLARTSHRVARLRPAQKVLIPQGLILGRGAYGRQPPSWLLQEIRSLTPAAGNPVEGSGTAQSKLTALGRHFTNELAITQQSLQRELTPTNRQELEARQSGLEAGIVRVQSALGAFGSQSAPPAASDAPDGVDPADWEFMTPDQRSLFQ